jgi:transcriptional regulator with XRE-family HTH domain
VSEPGAAQKRRRYLASLGYTATASSEQFLQAQAKIRSYRARGMSQAKMCEVTGLLQSTFHSFERNGGILTRNWEKVMRMPFVPPSGTDMVPSLGSRRRLGSLWHDGFTLPFLAERIGGVDRLYLQRMIRGRAGTASLESMIAERAERIADLYDKLECRKPAEFGIDVGSSKRARTYALKRGCVPCHCWDPDTIDDPKAIPEWTGACGTAEGLRIHQREGIPACPPCLAVNLGPAAGAVPLNPAKLKAAREARRLTLPELGKTLGVHESTIHYWETGRSAPRSRSLVDRYLAVLDLCPEEAV